jgi:HEAT repeat protein
MRAPGLLAIAMMIFEIMPCGAASAATPADALSTAALSDPELRSQVMARLATIDTRIPDSAWRFLGQRAEPVLRDVASDRSNLPTRRAKALDGLAVVGGTAVAAIFRATMLAESEPLVVRFAALRGLGRVANPELLPTELRPALEGAGDANVRAFAGEVLVQRAGRTACPMVWSQVSSESEATRGHFEHALRLCDDR